MAEAEAARRAPPLERGAETDASAGGEHRKHTDAAKLTSLVPLSRRAAFFAGLRMKLAACKALARFDQASQNGASAPSGGSAPLHAQKGAIGPPPKTRVQRVSFESAGSLKASPRHLAPGARLPEDAHHPWDVDPRTGAAPAARAADRSPSLGAPGSHHAQRSEGRRGQAQEPLTT